MTVSPSRGRAVTSPGDLGWLLATAHSGENVALCVDAWSEVAMQLLPRAPTKLLLDSKDQAVRGPSQVESLSLLPLALGHAPPEARFLSEEASTGFQLSAISMTGSCSICKKNGCVSRPQALWMREKPFALCLVQIPDPQSS